MRFEDEKNLCLFAESVMGMPFEWGETDCLTLALDWLYLLTGENQIEKYWERKNIEPYTYHKSEEKAIANCVELGPFFLEILKDLGAEKIKPNYQTLGDFIFIKDENLHYRVHVCLGETVLAATNEYGVIKWPISMMEDFEVYRWHR